MALTVGQLKKYLQDVPDDTVFGAMSFADKAEFQTFSPKRFLYLSRVNCKNIVVINQMGTHYNDVWEKENKSTLLGWVDAADYKLHTVAPK